MFANSFVSALVGGYVPNGFVSLLVGGLCLVLGLSVGGHVIT